MNKFSLITIILLFYINLSAQPKQIKLSLQEVIEIATIQSPDAIVASHQFKSSYWQYRAHKASLKPNLSLNATTPSLNRTLQSVQQPDGSEQFIQRNMMSNNMNLSLSQNISLTGATLSVGSGLSRIDVFGQNNSIQYMATPLNISISQPLNGFNNMKWEKITAPLNYERDKKAYIIAMENIATRSISIFFSYATAQLNYEIAKLNYENADTLFKIGTGRYNIGTIAEDEVLQLELGLINARINLKKSILTLQQQKSEILNYLNYDNDYDIDLEIPTSIPEIVLDFEQVLQLARENNPEVISNQLQILNAEKELAQTKSETGFKSELMASYNLNQTAENLDNVYKNPQNGQVVQLGIVIPILDWGKSKGQIKMAQSNMDVVKSNIAQAHIQFEQDIYNNVMEFNFQNEMYLAACKSDTIAQMRYHISKKRYMINKISILDLNSALTQKDESRRNYLSSIQNYWTQYYNIRKLTLYDFLENKQIDVDFELLIK